jgi:hypothetical protein
MGSAQVGILGAGRIEYRLDSPFGVTPVSPSPVGQPLSRQTLMDAFTNALRRFKTLDWQGGLEKPVLALCTPSEPQPERTERSRTSPPCDAGQTELHTARTVALRHPED